MPVSDKPLSKEIKAMIKRIAKSKGKSEGAIRALWDKAVAIAIKVKKGVHEPGQHAFTVQIFRNLASL